MGSSENVVKKDMKMDVGKQVEVEIYKDGEYIMTCSSLSEAHLVTGNSLTTIGDFSAVEKTREHRAWEMLIRRLDYLNGFDGNRSQMEKTTRIVAQIWDDAGHEEENARRMYDLSY